MYGANGSGGGGGIGSIDPSAFQSAHVLKNAPTSVTGRVTEAISQAHQLTEQLLKVVSGLEGRISDVLRPAPPTGQNDAKNAANSMPSNAAGAVEALNTRLMGLLAYVQSIHERVDL